MSVSAETLTVAKELLFKLFLAWPVPICHKNDRTEVSTRLLNRAATKHALILNGIHFLMPPVIACQVVKRLLVDVLERRNNPIRALHNYVEFARAHLLNENLCTVGLRHYALCRQRGCDLCLCPAACCELHRSVRRRSHRSSSSRQAALGSSNG
jgi:hypothetical protein